jgi:hypothetical protein
MFRFFLPVLPIAYLKSILDLCSRFLKTIRRINFDTNQFIMNLSITTYKGFSKVSGHITLDCFFSLISSPTYEHLIRKIDRLVQAGKVQEATNVKRQLQFFTITANYGEKRLAESITGYNDLITIDIDGLNDEQVAGLRPTIEQDPATVGCFLTAKQHGYKILAYLDNPKTQKLRKACLYGETLSYDRLEEYHDKMYELTRLHYERLLGVKVDTSGKDLSRGVFASYDPKAFLSVERLERVEPVTARIVQGEAASKRKAKQKPARKRTATAAMDAEGINPITLETFNRCVRSLQRIKPYKEGNHNPFLFALGNKCFALGLNEEEVKRLAAIRFGENGKWNTDEPIGNAYIYTSKTEKAQKEKEDRRPAIEKAKAFLNERYIFRRNTLLERLEFKDLSPENEGKGFRVMAVKDLNTIYSCMSEAGITYSYANLKAFIDSDYARPFDPILEYFDSLPAWDETTDYIGQLADTVETTDQEYWHWVFRCWMVGMAACAMGTKNVNQHVLLLHGKQGEGKSSWIRNLLPPELQEYYRNGMIDAGCKDDMLLLTNRIVINMEEFEGVKPSEVPALKRIISQESVTLRKPYDIQARTYPRRASFIGSTNNARFLSDLSGSRRFLVVQTKAIDFRTPIDYTGVYSQIIHLIKGGFRHWFEEKEVNKINVRNEQHRMIDPLEENLYIYFRPATPRDWDVKWKPAAAILAYLSMAGRTQANAQTQQLLVQILERDGFMKRVNDNGITEYGVLVLTQEEIEQNTKRI